MRTAVANMIFITLSIFSQFAEELEHVAFVAFVHAEDFVFVAVVFAEVGDGNITRERGLETVSYTHLQGNESA